MSARYFCDLCGCSMEKQYPILVLIAPHICDLEHTAKPYIKKSFDTCEDCLDKLLITVSTAARTKDETGNRTT